MKANRDVLSLDVLSIDGESGRKMGPQFTSVAPAQPKG
jgi:hypothetical protein